MLQEKRNYSQVIIFFSSHATYFIFYTTQINHHRVSKMLSDRGYQKQHLVFCFAPEAPFRYLEILLAQ